MHLVNLRNAVRSAEQNLVAFRKSRDAGDSALECLRSNRRDVIDESLRLHLDQFRGHVATDRHQVTAVIREDRVENPVVVRTLIENLFAG